MSAIIIHETGLSISPKTGCLPDCRQESMPVTLTLKISNSGQVKITYTISDGAHAFFKEKTQMKKEIISENIMLTTEIKTVRKKTKLCSDAPLQDETFKITVVIEDISNGEVETSFCYFSHICR